MPVFFTENVTSPAALDVLSGVRVIAASVPLVSLTTMLTVEPPELELTDRPPAAELDELEPGDELDDEDALLFELEHEAATTNNATASRGRTPNLDLVTDGSFR